jgi:hypothetical protein
MRHQRTRSGDGGEGEVQRVVEAAGIPGIRLKTVIPQPV